MIVCCVCVCDNNLRGLTILMSFVHTYTYITTFPNNRRYLTIRREQPLFSNGLSWHVV